MWSCAEWAPRAALLVMLASCAPEPPLSAQAFAKRVEGKRGMVATSHPEASRVGVEILRAGGNAVDAAVAVGFALSVVDPSQTGIGGAGGLVAWQRRPRQADAIVFYARTGSDSAWAQVAPAAGRSPINERAAGIPGTVAGLLEAHGRWGRLPLTRILEPAIRLASDGFIVSPLLSRTVESARAKLAADSQAARLFLPDGKPIQAGDRLVQSELAATLRAIASGGLDAFYDGPLAQRAVEKLRASRSPVTLEDWKSYRAAVQRPLCTPWLNYTVLSVPPPLSGATVLEALNLLAATEAQRLGSPTVNPDAALATVGAMRLADADRRRWRGDPAHYAVPARGIASPAFAQERAPGTTAAASEAPPPGDPWTEDQGAVGGSCETLTSWPASQLGPERAAAAADSSPPDAASHTSHFSIVDSDRNAVAVTFTVGVLFGSGVYVNGYFLNSGANNFDVHTRGPSRFGSSTVAPTILLEDDDVRLVVGAAGSEYIPTSITQVAFRTLGLNQDPWMAIAAPRLQPGARGRPEVEAEPGFAPEVYAALRQRGYTVISRVSDLSFGGVHAVLVTRRGELIGVADPRRDGTAAGW